MSILGDILFLYSSKDRYDTALSYKTYVFLFKVHSSYYLNLWSLFCWASFRSALDKQELVKYKYDKPMINVQIWVPRKLVRVWYHFKWFLKLQSDFTASSYNQGVQKFYISRDLTYIEAFSTTVTSIYTLRAPPG